MAEDANHGKEKPGKNLDEVATSNSETTIYHNVLRQANENEVVVDPEITFRVEQNKNLRNSSSSEDHIDTSDEVLEVELDINDKFIADCQAEEHRRKSGTSQQQGDDEEPQPGCSQSHRIIQEAEASKAKIYGVPGNGFPLTTNDDLNDPVNITQNIQSTSTSVDGNYIMVGSHVDLALQEKIKRGEYVDFARLIP